MIVRFSILFIFLFSIFIDTTAQNTVKKYFFGSEDFYKSNSELILIVDNPQTEIAKEIGSRYYSDTNFLKLISKEFFTEVDTSNHDVSMHMCGYDMFFYVRNNDNLTYLRAINSNCDLEEIGIIDANSKCKNLETLTTSGIKLKLDTIHYKISPSMKDSVLLGTVYHKNLDIHENSDSRPSEAIYWFGNNNCRNLPVWYYDGIVQETLRLNSNITIEQNIISYLTTLGITNAKDKAINWRIHSEIAEDIEFREMMGYPVPREVPIKFYFSSEYFENFDSLEIQKIDIEQLTDIENTPRHIILYKIPEL